MQDQVDALRALGVSAAFLNSTVDYHTYVETANDVRAGKVKLLYMAPETLLRPETLVMLDRANVDCITIDEAHCISSWGHDFRPEYRQLLSLRRRLPRAVWLALTATATRRVQDDIKDVLGFGAGNTFVASFNRPNLYLTVQPRTARLPQLMAFLDAHRDESGIIYTNRRKDAETLAEQLTQLGRPALPYHAGMDDALRRDHQRRFTRDEAQMIVATIAFGMGINKSNVRFILHTALPENLENYYQQIGRAGRDGEPAAALLLYCPSDLGLRRFFASSGALDEEQVRQVLDAILMNDGHATPDDIADMVALSQSKQIAALNRLVEAGAITRLPDGAYQTNAGAEDAQLEAVIHEAVDAQAKRREYDRSRVEMIRAYAELTGCRRQHLLSYFGEELAEPCGHCDNCEAGAAHGASADAPFAAGSRVAHKRWGEGQVLRLEGENIVILFDSVGYKTLSAPVVIEGGLLTPVA